MIVYQVYWVGIISLMRYRFYSLNDVDMWESKRGVKTINKRVSESEDERNSG